MNKYQNLIDKYGKISQELHEGQFRNDGKKYFTHIQSVEDIVINNYFNSFPSNERRDYYEAGLAIVAFGHDGKEDQLEKYNSIFLAELQKDMEKDLFGELQWFSYIISGINAISKKPKGQEEYVDYLFRVKTHEWARLVKIADLTHNMSDLAPGNLRDKYSISKYFLEH